MSKYALVVGINNYSVQSAHDSPLYQIGWPNLANCVNDANSMYHLLQHATGIPQGNMTLLTEARATRRNILSALNYYLVNLQPGDVFCFFFAGHGGSLPATTSSTNNVFYESIIPYSGDWIYDFNLQRAISRAGVDLAQVNITMVIDSCHSGGLHSSDSIQQNAPRSIPFSASFVQTMQHMQTNWPFGICLPSGSNELIPNVSNPVFTNRRLTDLDEDPDKTLVQSPTATLLSACKFHEYAGDGTTGNGVFTQSILNTVNQSNWQMSYSDMIDRLITEAHRLSGNSQTPQLRGSQSNASHNFLSPF